MNVYALKNGIIHTGDSTLTDQAIIIEQGKVSAICPNEAVADTLFSIDLNGLHVAPGFIDLQIYGGGGCLFNHRPTIASIQKIYEYNKPFGTTNFLITLPSTSLETIKQGIEATRQWLRDSRPGLVGLHLEGPYLNPLKKGAHPEKNLRKVNIDELNELIISNKDVVKIITIAPELFTDQELDLLFKSGIVVAAGHSNVTYGEAKHFFEKGIKHVTHLFNAMNQFNSREPGLVGATLDANTVHASIVVDGIHCDFASVRISKKIMQERLFLITDATDADPNGDYKIKRENGRWVNEDGTLAGSSLTMIEAVKNCVKAVGIGLEESLRMASTYPAQVIGLNDQLGKIACGYDADLVIFDASLTVQALIVKGDYQHYSN